MEHFEGGGGLGAEPPEILILKYQNLLGVVYQDRAGSFNYDLQMRLKLEFSPLNDVCTDSILT